MDSKTLDLSSKLFSHNPYLIYDELRKSGTVHFLPKNDTWLVIGFDEIVSVLNNPSVFTSMGENSFDPILLNCDPPKHTIHRKILSSDQALFSTNRVGQLELKNTEIAKNLIDALKEKKTIDILKDFSLPFSSLVILNLLGITTQENEALRKWSLSAVSNESIHNADYAQRKWFELKPIVQNWIEEIKETPNNIGLAEIIFNSYAKDNFSDEEILNLTKVLLLGGNETTPNLISSALYLLLNDQIVLNIVRNDLSLIDSVVNETLRLEAPTQIIQRSTKEEVKIGNTIIPKGSLVSLAIGAANRDPFIFESPDAFILNRKKSKILSFGFGPHYCIGAHLARQEAKIALKQLLTNFPNIRLTSNKLITYRHSSHIRGIKELYINIQPVSSIDTNMLRSKLIRVIKEAQLTSGEFPTYEYYPNSPELLEKGWQISNPSPFVHANIIYALMKIDKTIFAAEIEKGLSFLRHKKEKGDVWRFWSIQNGINNVPPDTDDTSICSTVLTLSGDNLNNRATFLSNITLGGVIKTWFFPNLNGLVFSPKLMFKWLSERKYVLPTIKAGLLEPEDFEVGVMANTLLYLGEDEKTKPIIDVCIKMWTKNQIESHFYNSKLVIAYHIARAYDGGVMSFSKLSNSIVEMITTDFEKYELAEQILSGLTLSYLKYEGRINTELNTVISNQLERDDLELTHFGYFTSKDRNYFAGSNVLVASWLLELLNFWENRDV